jgi:hypothetical protein
MGTKLGNKVDRLLNAATTKKRGSGMSKFSASTAKIAAIILLAVTLQGCVPQLVMNSMDHEHYSDYVTKTEQINYERQKSGLQPVQIMTFQQWKGA